MTEHDMPALENKAAGVGHDALLTAFAAFKDANDERLAQLEARAAVDAVTAEKVDTIGRAMDALSLKAARPALSAEPQAPRGRGFDAYVRAGDTRRMLMEGKALSAGTGGDGGYLVPEEIEATVMRRLGEISPIRAIAGNRTVSAGVFKKPFAITGLASGWAAETGARAQTATPTLAELSFPTMELFAQPAATQTLLDDSAVNIDEWIAEEVRTAFASQENAAFVNGDGVNKPKGFMAYDTVAESAWVWGKLGTISTGSAAGFSAANPADNLIDLIYTLKASYRQNARFVMNRAVQAAVRKIKDADGQYIWRPSDTAGGTPTLMGYGVTETEDMPNIAAGANAIAFGDFGRGYLVVDRKGLNVLRDPYSAKPYVLFYTTKRVGGGVQDFDAIKLLKFAA